MAEGKKTTIDGIDVHIGHPVAEVLKDLLVVVGERIPPGFSFMLAVRDESTGIGTCGGNHGIDKSFVLAVNSARQIMIASGAPGIVERMLVRGRGGTA